MVNSLEFVAEGEILVVLVVLTTLCGRSGGRGGGRLGRQVVTGRGRRGGRGDGEVGSDVGSLGLVGVGGCRGGRDDGAGGVASRCRWDLDITVHTENLADVEVIAVLLELGVVGEEDGRVDVVLRGNSFAGVVGDDGVGGRAILASVAEAEGAAGDQIGAGIVNAGVDSRQLVSRDVVSSRDTVTNVAFLDGVLSSAFLCESLGNKRESENYSTDEHSGNE